MADDKIFDIKPIDGNLKVKENKRQTVSVYNRIKNFKYADLPAECDKCVYRSIDEGGNGKCTAYEKGAVCAIRDDIKGFLTELDTRDPEDLKQMLDFLSKQAFENVMMAFAQAKMDGNIPDRNTQSQTNTLINLIKLMSEVSNKITVTEKKEYTKEGDLINIFRELKARKVD